MPELAGHPAKSSSGLSRTPAGVRQQSHSLQAVWQIRPRNAGKAAMAGVYKPGGNQNIFIKAM
jgi:hypothetical protein